MARVPISVGKAVYGKAAFDGLSAGALREIGIGLGVGFAMGLGWKAYHSNDRYLIAQANKQWLDRKADLRARAAAAADRA